MPAFCAEKLKILRRVIYKFCTAFFVNLAQILCTFFRKEEKQIYKHFALTLNDIKINPEITTHNEKRGHLLHGPGT